MSLDDVAKVTKIQPRILERLETGRFDGLPPEVFVRGFVRSFARCVGLDEREALRRYAACAIGSQDLTPTVRALVEAMADLAPDSATTARATPRKMQAVEVIDLVAPVVLTPRADPDPPGGPADPEATSAEAPPAVAAAPRSVPGVPCGEADAPSSARVAGPVATAVEAPRAPGAAAASSLITGLMTGTMPEAIAPAEAAAPVEPIAASDPAPVACAPATSPVEAEPPAFRKKRGRRRRAREAAAREAAAAIAAAASSEATESAGATGSRDAAEDEAAASRERRAVATPASASAPWRRLVRRAPPASTGPARPSLVIDDADPESAERMQEERAERAGTIAPRRSFLPPILLDREDRSARQGGLTLAVILLLIAATLTLSYLMRRPSASGDGVTGREAPVLPAEQG